MHVDKEVSQIYFDMKQVSKICNIKYKGKEVGRNKLFELLRKYKILQEGNNLPFREFIRADYFKVEKKELEKSGQYTKEYSKTLVSQKGVDFIKEILNKDN